MNSTQKHVFVSKTLNLAVAMFWALSIYNITPQTLFQRPATASNSPNPNPVSTLYYARLTTWELEVSTHTVRKINACDNNVRYTSFLR